VIDYANTVFMNLLMFFKKCFLFLIFIPFPYYLKNCFNLFTFDKISKKIKIVHAVPIRRFYSKGQKNKNLIKFLLFIYFITWTVLFKYKSLARNEKIS